MRRRKIPIAPIAVMLLIAMIAVIVGTRQHMRSTDVAQTRIKERAEAIAQHCLAHGKEATIYLHQGKVISARCGDVLYPLTEEHETIDGVREIRE